MRVTPYHKRRLDIILLVTVPLALFVYVSVRPVVRLRPEMPPQFLEASPSANEMKLQAERRVAQAYWDVGVTVIQWQFTYGSPLPEDPPEEFRIAEGTGGVLKPATGPSKNTGIAAVPVGVAAASRLRYWRRLRELWIVPGSWTFHREWSSEWFTGSVRRAVIWLDRYVSDFIGHA